MDEFEGIFEPNRGDRPVMSRPPKVEASVKFIHEVRDMLADTEGVATDVADWIADKMERFGARTAEPVFTMNGAGPVCSWCHVVWPLCGHHHMSTVLHADDAPRCPECEAGKHTNCTNEAMTEGGEIVPCPCATTGHGGA